MNPYHELNVPRDAGISLIKEVYRRMAKDAHPDSPTGSEEAFNRLKEAYDVLIDPVRRKRYDFTGRTDTSKVTPERIKTMIDSTMESVVVAERPDGTSDSPEYENIRDKIISSLRETDKQVRLTMAKLRKKIARTDKLIRRFKPNKDTPDIVGESLKAIKARLQDDLIRSEDALELSEEVQKTFNSYGYEVGPEPEGQRDGPGPTIRRGGLLFYQDNFGRIG